MLSEQPHCGLGDQLRKAAGAVGLIVTLDWTFSHGRDWGSPFIPSVINLEAIRKLGLDVALHPAWLWRFAKTGRLPDLTTPNMVPRDQVEVVLDDGVRRGGDVVKAVALGAKAVMIGRAYLWGLAAGGQTGVEDVLAILRSGIDSTLLGLGKNSIDDLRPEDVIVPADFNLALGTETPASV